MSKSLFAILSCIVCSAFGYGQITIAGRILNSSSREPISYANIGIRNSNVGTISNADGSFSLIVPRKLSNDTLVISSLGFAKKRVAVNYVKQEKALIIHLNEKRKVLAPVVVTSTKPKLNYFDIGNKQMRGGVLEADTTYAGRSIALLISPSQEQLKKGIFPAYLEKARIRILRNNLKSFRIRVRLNAVDSQTGQPGEDLLQQSIISESTMRSGWLVFDLSALNYEASKPFFVTFEQILDFNDRSAIARGYQEFIRKHPRKVITDSVEFEGKKEVRQRITWGGIDLPGVFIGISATPDAIENNTCYVRETSFAEWKKVRGIVSATVTLSTLAGGSAVKNETPCKEVSCRAERICTDFIDEYGLTGMQIAVSRNNKMIWSASLGYADAANKIAVTDSTKFRINSVSKSVTSVALLKLVGEKKLDLDKPIHQYIPSFPQKPYPITARQLAGHQAGFRDYKIADVNDYVRTAHFENATQALDIFKEDTLLFEPGTSYSYSTFGWNLLGAVIEAISGENYLDHMYKNVWHPLGMSNTCGDNSRQTIPNRSKFYDPAGEENDFGDVSYKYPGGGLLSTAGDLVRLGNELLYGNTIDPDLKKILFQSQQTRDGKETGYGLGWYTGTDRNGRRIWHHAGDGFSSSAHLIIYPDEGLVIAFLANSQYGVAFDMEKMGELFYKN